MTWFIEALQEILPIVFVVLFPLIALIQFQLCCERRYKRQAHKKERRSKCVLITKEEYHDLLDKTA